MTLYVYAILRAADGAPAPGEIQGFDNQPLACCAGGPVAAIFSDHPVAEFPVTPANILTHERAIEALMHCRTLLPTRYGVTFPDEQSLAEVLVRHAGKLSAALDRVTGCVELGLRVIWKNPASAPRPFEAEARVSGRAYMQARLAGEQSRQRAQRQAEPLAAAIHLPLASLSRDATRRVLAAPDLLLSSAYLVPTDTVPRFRDQLHDAAQSYPELRLLCTGPWPPYHFTPALHQLTEGSHV